MFLQPRRRFDDSGFTVIEILVGLAILSILAVAIPAISISGVVRITDESVERHQDATTAQWVSVAFARDVQGAASIATQACEAGAGGTDLVTLAYPAADRRVGYRAVPDGDGFALVRTECAGTELRRVVVDGLLEAPTVACEPVGCAPSASPQAITLALRRTERFEVALAGTPRSRAVGSVAPRTVPTLFAIGGTAPLSASGNAVLRVDGDAAVNRSATGAAVQLNGAGLKLDVTGTLQIQEGGACSGCSAGTVRPFPIGSFPAALPDPFADLPAPTVTGPIRTGCPGQVCQPGVYPSALSFNGGTTTLLPGVYVLEAGFEVKGNASVVGSGVMLYNERGSVSIAGNGTVALTPPSAQTVDGTTERYVGVLLFQARTNAAGISISGNGSVGGTQLGGVLYAPTSSGVQLGGGNGTLRIGRVVGVNLSVSGNGTVELSGG